MLDGCGRRLAMHQDGELAGEPALGGPLLRALRCRLFQLGQLVGRQEGEPP